jgi:hypothetical protein
MALLFVLKVALPVGGSSGVLEETLAVLFDKECSVTCWPISQGKRNSF